MRCEIDWVRCTRACYSALVKGVESRGCGSYLAGASPPVLKEHRRRTSARDAGHSRPWRYERVTDRVKGGSLRGLSPLRLRRIQACPGIQDIQHARPPQSSAMARGNSGQRAEPRCLSFVDQGPVGQNAFHQVFHLVKAPPRKAGRGSFGTAAGKGSLKCPVQFASCRCRGPGGCPETTVR